MIKKNTINYCISIGIVIGLGLLSRTVYTPQIIYPYLGDILYAIMIFFIFKCLFQHTTSIYVMCIAITVCYGIELLQLYQASWINAIRQTILGRLVLGQGFLWSDIGCYTLGGLLAFYIDKQLFKDKN